MFDIQAIPQCDVTPLRMEHSLTICYLYIKTIRIYT